METANKAQVYLADRRPAWTTEAQSHWGTLGHSVQYASFVAAKGPEF